MVAIFNLILHQILHQIISIKIENHIQICILLLQQSIDIIQNFVLINKRYLKSKIKNLSQYPIMQIKINSKYNQKMLQNYPDDPYSDLCIKTTTKKLNLVLAYLSIDSTFFAEIDPDTRQVNLSHLNQQPLIRVIRSLYGQQLIANTISQLAQLYQIIIQLQVDDYKTNIEKQIMQKPHVIQSIQFLQFSFSNYILMQQVIEYHIQNKLKMLENNRNYLQLNKISQENFQILVERFIQSMIKKYSTIENLLVNQESQIINHVMENYFNRNNIKAMNYFKQVTDKCNNMEVIWNKYHHSIYFSNSSMMGQSLINTPTLRGTTSQLLTVKSPVQNRLRKKSEEVINVNVLHSTSSSPQIQRKKKKVEQLQEQLKQRQKLIIQLQKQINHIKLSRLQQQQKIVKRNSGGNHTGILPQVLDEQQLMKQSIEQQNLSYLPNIKKTRKSKEYEQEEDFTVSSVFEPAFNGNRKLPQAKEVKTMKKLTAVRNKFLPN